MLLLNLTPLRFSSLRFLKLNENFQSRSITIPYTSNQREQTPLRSRSIERNFRQSQWRQSDGANPYKRRGEPSGRYASIRSKGWNQDPIPLLCPVFPIISSFNAFPARDYTPVSTSTDATPPMPMDTARTGRRRAKLEVARVVVGGGGGIGRRGGRTIRCLFPRLRAGQSN